MSKGAARAGLGILIPSLLGKEWVAEAERGSQTDFSTQASFSSSVGRGSYSQGSLSFLLALTFDDSMCVGDHPPFSLPKPPLLQCPVPSSKSQKKASESVDSYLGL